MPSDTPGSDRPIRVLRVVTRLNIGGPAIQAMTLSERLQPRGFDTLLVHGQLDTAEGDMRYLLASSVPVRHLRALRRPIRPGHDILALAQLVDILRTFRPDIVHTHTAKAGTLGRLAAAIYNRTAGRGARARVVHTYHGHVLDGYFGPAVTQLFIGVERQLSRTTDRIVAISPQIRDELLEEHRIGTSDQYRVVPLGFDLHRLTAIDAAARAAARGALQLATDAHVVTTVGRMTAIKQHQLFLEAARHVATADPAAIFLLVGDGELRSVLEAAARDLGIADRTRFLGWRRDLTTIYGASDVFLLTSRNEGTPVALIESLAAAVSVVSTDVGGVRDVVEHGRVGLLAPFGNARALADHVVTLLGDRDLRRRMGDAGRESIVAKHGLDRLLDDIAALYRELLHP